MRDRGSTRLEAIPPSQVVMAAKRPDLRRLSGSDGTRTRDLRRAQATSRLTTVATIAAQSLY